MINSQNDLVAWVMLVYELEDAQDGLKSLLEDMAKEKEFDEVEFSIHMAHIFSHLNRAWNARNATEEQHQDNALWEEWRKFPTDLEL